MPNNMKKRLLIWNGVIVLAMAIAICVALPSFIKARQDKACIACFMNLRLICGGKGQALYTGELERDADCDDPHNKVIVNQYIKSNASPMCPNGGTYRYGKMNEEPMCSLLDPKDKSTFAHGLNRGRKR